MVNPKDLFNSSKTTWKTLSTVLSILPLTVRKSHSLALMMIDHHDHDNVDDDDDDDNGATSRHRHSLTPDKRSPGHLSTLQDRPDLQVLSVDPPGHHNLQIWKLYLRVLIVHNFDSTIATIENSKKTSARAHNPVEGW